MPYIGKSTDGFGIRERFTYVVSAGATSISGADANGRTLTFEDPEYVDVFLNGVRLKKDTDYNLNTANTAGVNAVNQANAMNAFNLSNQGLSFIWQEMRDSAKWEYESAQNAQERQTNLAIAALGNEAASDQGRADILKTLGGFAMDIWSKMPSNK